MPRRRDRVTNQISRVRQGTNYTPTIKNPYNRSAEGRFGGRRGVRARARQARIEARIANGTYRQPSGGETTNS